MNEGAVRHESDNSANETTVLRYVSDNWSGNRMNVMMVYCGESGFFYLNNQEVLRPVPGACLQKAGKVLACAFFILKFNFLIIPLCL